MFPRRHSSLSQQIKRIKWNCIYTFLSWSLSLRGFRVQSFQFKKRHRRKRWHCGHPGGLHVIKPSGCMSVWLTLYQTWQLLMISFICLIASMEESLSASPSKTGLLLASCDTNVARFLAQTCVSGWKQRDEIRRENIKYRNAGNPIKMCKGLASGKMRKLSFSYRWPDSFTLSLISCTSIIFY